ncbi:MAG: alpha/beta fold hydrolase [Bacteroidota bacterium]|nr:alpha/beta fold hydrolase [Bacteroidota bacterium]
MNLCLNNGLKDCIVIGHSMGGKVAMCLALEHPEIIAKLVVVDIAPKEYFIYDYLRKMIEAIRDTKLNEFNKRTDLEAYILSQVDDIRIAQFLTKNIQRNNRGEFEWKFYAEGIIRNMINMGKAVEKGNLFEKPTLFIKGEKSKFILNEDYALIKEYFSNAEIQIIKNAGHWVHADQPEEFLDRVLNFIL